MLYEVITVFYLMIPVIKSMGIKNPKKFSLYLMVVIAGGVMAHSLIPPTPGPLFVAETMNIDLGTMMIGGIVIGLVTVLSGYVITSYSIHYTKLYESSRFGIIIC